MREIAVIMSVQYLNFIHHNHHGIVEHSLTAVKYDEGVYPRIKCKFSTSFMFQTNTILIIIGIHQGGIMLVNTLI